MSLSSGIRASAQLSDPTVAAVQQGRSTDGDIERLDRDLLELKNIVSSIKLSMAQDTAMMLQAIREMNTGSNKSDEIHTATVGLNSGQPNQTLGAPEKGRVDGILPPHPVAIPFLKLETPQHVSANETQIVSNQPVDSRILYSRRSRYNTKWVVNCYRKTRKKDIVPSVDLEFKVSGRFLDRNLSLRTNPMKKWFDLRVKLAFVGLNGSEEFSLHRDWYVWEPGGLGITLLVQGITIAEGFILWSLKMGNAVRLSEYLAHCGYCLMEYVQTMHYMDSCMFSLSEVTANLRKHALYGGVERGTMEHDRKTRIMYYLNDPESENNLGFTVRRASVFESLTYPYLFHTNKWLVTMFDHKSQSVNGIAQTAKEKGLEAYKSSFKWPTLKLFYTDLKKLLSQKKKKQVSAVGIKIDEDSIVNSVEKFEELSKDLWERSLTPLKDVLKHFDAITNILWDPLVSKASSTKGSKREKDMDENCDWSVTILIAGDKLIPVFVAEANFWSEFYQMTYKQVSASVNGVKRATSSPTKTSRKAVFQGYNDVYGITLEDTRVKNVEGEVYGHDRDASQSWWHRYFLDILCQESPYAVRLLNNTQKHYNIKVPELHENASIINTVIRFSNLNSENLMRVSLIHREYHSLRPPEAWFSIGYFAAGYSTEVTKSLSIDKNGIGPRECLNGL